MEPTTPANVTTVIAHGPCPDGASAMWVLNKWLKQHRPGDKIRWIIARPGDDLPYLDKDDSVMILDYSYNSVKTNQLMTKVNRLMILDHHKTAQAELASVPDHLKIFDMNRSGCGIAWDYCFPTVDMPMFLQCIQDRDIWQNKIPKSQDFGNYLQILDLTDLTAVFDQFDQFEDLQKFEQALIEGSYYAKLNKSYIDWATNKVDISLGKLGGKYYQVGTVNSTVLKSDIGNAIVTKNPYVDFAVVWSGGPGYTKFSLRSINNRSDVSEIAKLFGGGGHRNASGVYMDALVSRLPARYFDIDLSKHIPLIKIHDLVIQNQSFSIAIMAFPHKRNAVASYLAQNIHLFTQSKVHAVCVGSYDWTRKMTSYVLKPVPDSDSKILEQHKVLEFEGEIDLLNIKTIDT